MILAPMAGGFMRKVTQNNDPENILPGQNEGLWLTLFHAITY